MDLHLGEVRALVTAGAGGIGLEIVRALREAGARVALCDLDEDALGAARAADAELFARRCDVADEAEAGAFVSEAVAALGGLDLLVNNAGIAGPTAPLEKVDAADWARTLDVCLTGAFYVTRAAIPALRASDRGRIVMMSSAAGRLGFANRAPYAAAKWGVIGLTKSLARELGGDGITVNAILPGLVAGDRQRRVMEARAQAQGRTMAEIEAEAFAYASIKDYVTPRQIADQVLFLASPSGATISGQAIAIDGDLGMLG
ncbi:SDR family oxidoreductase [Jannaschia seohaensis]|uniref:NAD(P)-dependent dehydrogenase (Short-subunit alcohol dehydrogenase family) n=1 Tax=Jannaschia seohaensis TaxID=475081 RepID=A0A2Y9BVV9_9RHOB|nr:SDR family oxidoreductase [Jannaschia seohaensis]PWJ21744.1 NAD(P)-dependent dehydrogenase (short-subunit alcohol dehydrogenase family) [Jannaschia seohaensis]SSA38022.1 NAD(P)-dependent dehydrogenase, short-chain alcohol dehydrogenase family [Jannaschia seohaensis]